MSQPPPPYPGAPGYNVPGAPPPDPAYPDKSHYQPPPPGQFQPPPPGYSQSTQHPPGAYPTAWAQPGHSAPMPAAYPGQAGQPVYPPPGPQPAYGQPPTVVISQPQVVTTVVQTMRDNPTATKCPYCQADIVTSTYYEAGSFTWLACAILCLVGCDLGCCLIPFCVNDTKDCVHTCPNCKQQVARWNRL